jgi:hypothetical protein
MKIPNIIKSILNSRHSLQNKFTGFYNNNTFEGTESKSGEGSSLEQTKQIRQELPNLFNELQIKTFVDAPCGDHHWMKEIDLSNIKYTGIDIVEQIISLNNNICKADNKTFVCLDIVNEIVPKVDLILCRDCLVHLSFEQAIKVLKNFKQSGSKYLLVTTFPGRAKNSDLKMKIWRTLNLEKEPFNLPEPIRLINEGCTEADMKFSDKSLGLWLLEQIHF